MDPSKLNILITGPAGSGKTTLLELLGGYDLDELGYRFPTSHPSEWLISTEIVEYRIRETDLDGPGNINYYGGLCSNMRGLVNLPDWDGFIVLVPLARVLYRNLLGRQSPERDDTHILELLDTEEGVSNYHQQWRYDFPRWLGSVAKTLLICYGSDDTAQDLIDVINGMDWEHGRSIGVVGDHTPFLMPELKLEDCIFKMDEN